MEEDLQTMKQYGRELGVLLDNLDIPQSFKIALIEIMQDLSLENLEKIYLAVRESLEEQAGMDLNKKYQESTSEIDTETEAELDGLLQEIS